MFRKFVGAVFLAAVTLGVAAGEEFFAVVLKVEGGKVTFRKVRDRKAKEHKPPEDITLPAAPDVKVFKAKGLKAGKLEVDHELPGRLDNEWLKEGLKQVKVDGPAVFLPVAAWFTTDDSGKTIKEMRVVIVEKKEGK